MGNHYYTNQPEVAHDRKKWQFDLLGKEFSFITDSNVFSKGTVDYGSRVLIEQYDDSLVPEGKLLDVGCGYGPIGLSLAHHTGREVDMVDVNERAVALAKENAELNHVTTVTPFLSNIYESVTYQEYAAILTNPPIRAGKKVVHQILEEAYDHLKIEGGLFVVIQKKQGAPSAKQKMADIFGNVETLKLDKGYSILYSKKIK